MVHHTGAVLVLGDLMLDMATTGTVSRICPEAPVPVVVPKTVTYAPGGAANVAAGIASLGIPVYTVGVVGDDQYASILEQQLTQCGVVTKLIRSNYTTLVKHRIWSDTGSMLLRIDTGDTKDKPCMDVAEAVTGLLSAVPISVVVVSDYNKGSMTDILIQHVKTLVKQRSNISLIVDCKPDRVRQYKGVTLVKPNMSEAMSMLDSFGEVHPGLAHSSADVIETGLVAAKMLRQHIKSAAVVITAGADGCFYSDATTDTHAPAVAVNNVYDVCGAGDTVMAALCLGIIEGWAVKPTLEFAMTAANVAVHTRGIVRVTRDCVDQLLYKANVPQSKIMTHEQLMQFIARKKAANNRVVLANGCFDYMHAAHVAMLLDAKQQGDVLIVAVNSDSSVTQLKGTDRPFVPLDTRMQHLSQLDCVNAVCCFDGDTALLVKEIMPAVLVKGADTQQTTGRPPGADIVEAAGGRVYFSSHGFNRHSAEIAQIEPITVAKHSE